METKDIKKLNIFEALAQINAQLPAITKNKENKQQDFKYRGIDDVYKTINPFFKEYGIISMPEVLDTQRYETESHKGTKLAYTLHKMKYTFYAPDGSNVSCVVYGEGMDTGDKSSNKSMAIAHKYALCQMFCIPTEDMPDPDADSFLRGKNSKPIPQKQQPHVNKQPSVNDNQLDPKRLDELKKWAEGKNIKVDVKDQTVMLSGKTYDQRDTLKKQGFKYDAVSKGYVIKLAA